MCQPFCPIRARRSFFIYDKFLLSFVIQSRQGEWRGSWDQQHIIKGTNKKQQNKNISEKCHLRVRWRNLVLILNSWYEFVILPGKSFLSLDMNIPVSAQCKTRCRPDVLTDHSCLMSQARISTSLGLLMWRNVLQRGDVTWSTGLRSAEKLLKVLNQDKKFTIEMEEIERSRGGIVLGTKFSF